MRLLASALEHSALWYFQRTAVLIGRDREAQALARMHYGNEQVGSERDLTTFWLDEPLAISADEQMVFLEKLVRRTLPFATRTIETVDALLLQSPAPSREPYRFRWR